MYNEYIRNKNVYIPKYNRITDEQAWEFSKKYNFGQIISCGSDNEIYVTHLPFIVNQEEKKVYFHFAKGNSHWKHFTENTTVKLVFQGPHSYISSSVYREIGVPTWNYATVHMNGTPKVIKDRNEIYAHLSKISKLHESKYVKQNQFSLDNMQKSEVEVMMNRIVAYEVSISGIEGKFKISQNKSTTDQESVINFLKNGDLAMNELADFMNKELEI